MSGSHQVCAMKVLCTVVGICCASATFVQRTCHFLLCVSCCFCDAYTFAKCDMLRRCLKHCVVVLAGDTDS